jgi:hypothetical protein
VGHDFVIPRLLVMTPCLSPVFEPSQSCDQRERSHSVCWCHHSQLRGAANLENGDSEA